MDKRKTLLLLMMLACVTLAMPLVSYADVSPGTGDGTAAIAGAGSGSAAALAPTEDLDPATGLGAIVKALQGGQWLLAVSTVVMLLLWATRKTPIGKWIPAKAAPWVSVALGLLSQILVSLASGTAWWQAIINGLTVGAAASGLWSLIGKHVLKKPTEVEG